MPSEIDVTGEMREMELARIPKAKPSAPSASSVVPEERSFGSTIVSRYGE